MKGGKNWDTGRGNKEGRRGESRRESRDGEVGVQGQLYLNIGLHNGVLLRTVVDQVTGDLSDTRTR